MTLREFLENATDDINYYIGAADGGGFFFIGKPQAALEKLPAISEDCYKTCKISLQHRRRELKNMKAKLKSKTTTMLISRKIENVKSAEEKVKNWIHLLDRRVVEAGKKSFETGYSVIVEGWCSGKYWSIDETDPNHKKQPMKINNPDGYDNLRMAIVTQAAVDYKKSYGARMDGKPEPADPELKPSNLEKFFRSELFDDLSDYDGEYVIKSIRKTVKREKQEAV